MERGHPARQRAQRAQPFIESARIVRASRSGGQDVRAPKSTKIEIMMSKIRVLPDHISNLIAAGEVVERPASVAKELVENAIDAGAQRIVIDVEAGGRRLLKITDDGEGMTRDDAVLAFERHATSKISKAEDLNGISTLGFRGEALASIASVARVELITSTADAAAGTRVVIEGGRMRDVKDAAHPRGTTIGVRDLFFNTPARRKFLRSEATESYHLTNLATHYALAHPEIAFTLTNNGRETLRVAPAQDLRERAYQVFGAQFLDGLLEVDSRTADAARAFPSQIARVQGFVSAPRERRTSRDAQFLFVNGRFVRDRIARSCRTAFIRRRSCSSRCHSKKLMSTFIRPRRKCAFAAPRPSRRQCAKLSAPDWPVPATRPPLKSVMRRQS